MIYMNVICSPNVNKKLITGSYKLAISYLSHE